MSPDQKPEFSVIVRVDDLNPGETVRAFAADDKTRAALARRLGVVGLERLAGEATLKLLPNGDVHMQLRAEAHVQQNCVVTLAPVDSTINIEFTTTYSATADQDWGHDAEEFEDIDADIEPPEALVEGKIDIAEACVEQLALEIDPFPRVKGATFDGYSTAPRRESDPEGERPNPFAVLSKLKTQQENEE